MAGSLSDRTGSSQSPALFCFVLLEKILSCMNIDQCDEFHVPSTQFYPLKASLDSSVCIPPIAPFPLVPQAFQHSACPLGGRPRLCADRGRERCLQPRWNRSDEGAGQRGGAQPFGEGLQPVGAPPRPPPPPPPSRRSCLKSHQETVETGGARAPSPEVPGAQSPVAGRRFPFQEPGKRRPVRRVLCGSSMRPASALRAAASSPSMTPHCFSFRGHTPAWGSHTHGGGRLLPSSQTHGRITQDHVISEAFRGLPGVSWVGRKQDSPHLEEAPAAPPLHPCWPPC